MKTAYITALKKLLQEGYDVTSLLVRLKSVMAERGHSMLYAPVLRAVLRFEESYLPRSGVRVTVAEVGDTKAEKKAIEDIMQQLSVQDHTLHVEVDPTIVGGVIVTTPNAVVDHSYKHALVQLYRRTITR